MDDKLKKLEDILGVLDKDTVTQDEFVKNFEVVIDFAKETRDLTEKELSMMEEMHSTHMKEMSAEMKTEWQKIKDKISQVKDGKTPTKQELLDLIEPLIPTVENGKDADEQMIVDTVLSKVPTIDLKPLEKKIKEVESKIVPFDNKRLDDIERIAKANQMPITTMFVNGERAKNLTFNNSIHLGDTANISIPVQPTAPLNPVVNQLWIDNS